MFVPGVISLRVTRDDIPQFVIVPLPLRSIGAAAVHVLFWLLSSMETLVACGDHGASFRETELS